MFANALLQYYESLVKAQTTAPLPDERHLREYVCELRDQWEKRVIVRELRLRAGIPVCCGEVDCLENPSSLCMRGEHSTCATHADGCFMCYPASSDFDS
jgi:hypothetical protein